MKATTNRRSQTVAPLLAVALSVSAAGAPVSFSPGDPITVAHESQNASGVRPRGITHLRDAWEGIRGIGDRTRQSALDINTIDEAPDSSWFENRIGARPMSIADIATGPNRFGPAPGQWTVTAGKSDGVTPGLQMKDSGGQLYFVKFDPPLYPELGTGAEVISTKLLYAAGYHVPENYLAIVGRDDLRIEPGATTRDGDRKRPMTENDLDVLLLKAARRPDGRYRVIASKALPGTPVGPFSYHGVRPDDPNDTVPHEHRRELRGLRVFAAWINHVDVKSENSLDTLVREDGRTIVRHNLIDFNATLGSAGIGPADRRGGYEYILDKKPILLSLLTFGLYVRPWQTVHYPDIASVGRFEGDRFDPARWKPTFPNRAMLNARPDDFFWAARRVMAFSDDAIRAVVETAHYSDPRATDTIAGALIKRRDKIGQEWLAGINPLVDFAIGDPPMLTFSSAAVTAGLSTPPSAYRIRWFRFDNPGRTIAFVGPIATVEKPHASVPDALRCCDEFIGAEVAAIHAQHPEWQRPVRVYFRRLEHGWTPVGLERLPDYPVNASIAARRVASLAAHTSTLSPHRVKHNAVGPHLNGWRTQKGVCR